LSGILAHFGPGGNTPCPELVRQIWDRGRARASCGRPSVRAEFQHSRDRGHVPTCDRWAGASHLSVYAPVKSARSARACNVYARERFVRRLSGFVKDVALATRGRTRCPLATAADARGGFGAGFRAVGFHAAVFGAAVRRGRASMVERIRGGGIFSDRLVLPQRATFGGLSASGLAPRAPRRRHAA